MFIELGLAQNVESLRLVLGEALMLRFIAVTVICGIENPLDLLRVLRNKMQKYIISDTITLTMITGNETNDYVFFKSDCVFVVVDYDSQTVFIESDGKLFESTNTLACAIEYIEKGALILYETETN
jgi:hypothetical protein